MTKHMTENCTYSDPNKVVGHTTIKMLLWTAYLIVI